MWDRALSASFKNKSKLTAESEQYYKIGYQLNGIETENGRKRNSTNAVNILYVEWFW